MASLKNIYVYSENNIFIFLAERAHRHNNGGYHFIKYNTFEMWNQWKSWKNRLPYVRTSAWIYESTGNRPNILPEIVPTHLHVSNPIYNIHCPFNVTKLVYINNWVDEKKFCLAQNVAELWMKIVPILIDTNTYIYAWVEILMSNHVYATRQIVIRSIVKAWKKIYIFIPTGNNF